MTKLAILGEYFGSLVPVKIQHVERFDAEPKADRKDGSGGSAGDQVEVLHDLIAAAAFHHVVPFCQDGRCERSSQAAAIERQDAEKTSSRDVFANQRQQFDLRDDAIDQFGNVGAFSQGPVLPRRQSISQPGKDRLVIPDISRDGAAETAHEEARLAPAHSLLHLIRNAGARLVEVVVPAADRDDDVAPFRHPFP